MIHSCHLVFVHMSPLIFLATATACSTCSLSFRDSATLTFVMRRVRSRTFGHIPFPYKREDRIALPSKNSSIFNDRMRARREKLIDLLHLTDCNYWNQSDMIVGDICYICDSNNAIFAKEEKPLKVKVRLERCSDLMECFGFIGRGMISTLSMNI